MGSESKDKIGDSGSEQEMPPATKKVMQSLKEIVNCTDCTDQEIYAVLQECDMDPDRAVERLLTQDTFQEVKSKRERRKEMKEAIDSRPRRYNVDLSRGGRISGEHNVHSGSTHGTCSELGKAAEKGEVGSVCPSVTSSMTCVIGKDMTSDSFRTNNRQQSLGSAGFSSRLQPTLLGASKGHLSMADIVRMDVSLAASDIQRLSLGDSKLEVLSTEDNSALVLPSHVQGLTDKCSHLSFGRYNSGSNSTSSATLTSHASNSGLEEKAAAVDGGSLAQNLDASNYVYHGDKLLGRDVFREAEIDKKYDLLSSFQQELVKRTSPEATFSHEYTTMSSIGDPSFKKSQWVSNPLPFKRPGLQNGNMSTFSSEMVMEPCYSLPQRSALLEDIRVQSFQQLEPDDKRGYHPQAQNHQYLPQVVQQPSSDSFAYGHPLADMKYSHPRNRKEFTMSRLTSARGRDAFGYGNPGSYNSGSFLHNSSIGPMMPSVNLDDILQSQYTNGRNGSLIQQHGGFSTWDYGQGFPSMSLPESMRHSSLGQPRQALPQYMTPGYSDLYHSGTGIPAQLQRQVGSQDFSPKQSRQFGNTATSSLHSSHNMPHFFH